MKLFIRIFFHDDIKKNMIFSGWLKTNYLPTTLGMIVRKDLAKEFNEKELYGFNSFEEMQPVLRNLRRHPQTEEIIIFRDNELTPACVFTKDRDEGTWEKKTALFRH